jgi:hypothetical protein
MAPNARLLAGPVQRTLVGHLRRGLLGAPAEHRRPPPGYTRTNLRTAGAALGRDKPKRSMLSILPLLPSQEVGPGAEPLLYAATSAAAVNGGYYGPGGRFGLIGPATAARPPRRARDVGTSARLWAEAERFTGTTLTSALTQTLWSRRAHHASRC